MIKIGAVLTDAIVVDSGSVRNNTSGIINITRPVDDGIEVLGKATFVNEGLIDATLVEGASTSRNAIAVGSIDNPGNFINETGGIIKMNGGTSVNARCMMVYEMGTANNKGKISTVGGNLGSSIYIRNNFVNDKNGILDLNDGRFNVNKGNFTNNGFILKKGGGSGVFSNDSLNVVINNAFFKYDSSQVFTSGRAILTDNGLKINNNGFARIDANKACTVDVGEVSYEWFLDRASYASSDATGLLKFADKSIIADSIVLTTSIPDVKLRIINICNNAVKTSGVNDKFLGKEDCKVYFTSPSKMVIEILNEKFNPNTVQIFSLDGRLLNQIAIDEKEKNKSEIDLKNVSENLLFIRLSDGKKSWHSKIFKP